MTVTATITGIDDLVKSLSSLPSRVVSGVKTKDELNYIKALVWDMGYVNRVIKPGPKTLWSVNVLGESKVLTITAPTGFIRVQRSTYLAVLREEFTKADFAGHPIPEWANLAEDMMKRAAQRCAELIARAAPLDKGDLRNSIVAADPGDDALSGSGYGPYGTYSVDMSDFLNAS